MKFSQLASYFEKIEKMSSRLEITYLLAELFDKLAPDEIDLTMYLLMGRVAPLYEAAEFGMAEKMVIKSIVSALNLEKKYFVNEFEKLGDLGSAVEKFKKTYQSFDEKDMSIEEVYLELRRITQAAGAGSQETKINILASLFRQLDPISCRYLARIPTGTMRMGFSDMTVLDALSWFINRDKTYRKDIEGAYHVRPDLGFIARAIKEHGIKGLSKVAPTVFTPILMMRAERLSSGQEIIEKIGECSVEPKYDGFRLQVHYSSKGSKVKLLTRNLENVSQMYPDIVEAVKKQVSADTMIFEGEAIGFDPYSGNFLPFQETVQRKRKYDIAKMALEIPLKFFTFDLLYLNGKSYINEPYLSRREALANAVKFSKNTKEDTILIAKNDIISDPKKLDTMFEESIAAGLEGIIAKKLDGIYQAGARGSNWIKFKRSYSSHIEDTIDCLVMGYDYGQGKRNKFGIGAFLVGVYDERRDKFETIAKIGTGLSDQEWRDLHLKSQKAKVKLKPTNYEVDKLMKCDVWVRPTMVVEIKADEITKSPVHTTGYALRFPRLERFRDDKRAEDATSSLEIEKLYKRQKP